MCKGCEFEGTGCDEQQIRDCANELAGVAAENKTLEDSGELDYLSDYDLVN